MKTQYRVGPGGIFEAINPAAMLVTIIELLPTTDNTKDGLDNLVSEARKLRIIGWIEYTTLLEYIWSQ